MAATTSLESLVAGARREFDLTRADDQESVRVLAEAFAQHTATEVHAALDSAAGDVPLEARMAALLARSRRWLRDHTPDTEIGIVFAMWGEQNRLLPASADNPNGENSLATKLEQLAWATRDAPGVRWRLYAVDDGCPHGSARIASEIAASHPLGDRVRVLSLPDALPATANPLRNLASAGDSRKAGAIILGAMRAIEDGAQAVIYTDADNSVHLGQIGLLLAPFQERERRVVLGSRKHPDSVLVKDAARWGVGIAILRHMQRMVGKAIFSRGILDTQAAFKLYESSLLARIIDSPTVYDFSFDTDWILAALACNETIEQVPFAFIDSFAESASITQGPMTTWETLLFGLCKSVRRHGFAEGSAAEMVDLIEQEIRGHEDLERIINLLPPALEHAGDADFGDPAVMSPEALRRWLRDVLGR
jgi:hypothetical protein